MLLLISGYLKHCGLYACRFAILVEVHICKASIYLPNNLPVCLSLHNVTGEVRLHCSVLLIYLRRYLFSYMLMCVLPLLGGVRCAPSSCCAPVFNPQAHALSSLTKNNVYFKREDMQPVFSFKIRGAYNRIVQLSIEQRSKGAYILLAIFDFCNPVFLKPGEDMEGVFRPPVLFPLSR